MEKLLYYYQTIQLLLMKIELLCSNSWRWWRWKMTLPFTIANSKVGGGFDDAGGIVGWYFIGANDKNDGRLNEINEINGMNLWL